MPVARHWIAELPDDARAEVLSCLHGDDYAGIVRCLKEHRESCSEVGAAALLVEAYATYRDAMEVMVDQVVPACQAALELLAKARAAGADDREATQLGQEIERTLLKAVQQVQEEESQLQEATAAADPDLLSRMAHRRWDRVRSKEAAELFLQAADAERAAASRRGRGRADHSFNYLVRAGLCFHEAGLTDRAQPLLEAALVFDWKSAGLWADRHMTEWAFAALLESHARQPDAEGFRRLWSQAVQRGEELEQPFPSIRPKQERLLELSMQLGDKECCRHVLARIQSREERIPKPVREQIARAEEFLAGGD